MTRIGALIFGSIVLACIALGAADTGHAQEGQWGGVKGRIVWGAKDVPPRPEITAVEKSPDKAVCCKNGPLLSDKWVVDKKTKGLKWTFVWLAPVKAEDKVPIHPSLKKLDKTEVDIDQPVCMFIPHSTGLREGQVLLAKNSSAISHNVKWTGNPATANSGGNVLIAPKGTVPIKGLVADRLPVKIECGIHPWMSGWVRVFDHPYYEVTGDDGSFEIKNAPAGQYRLMVWHGSGGWLGGAKGKTGQVITIPAGMTRDLKELKYVPPVED